MRNLSILGCLLALLINSGCQSGASGFRNPFKKQIARSFPNSSPELKTKSMQHPEELSDADQSVTPRPDSSDTGHRSISDTQGAADWRTGPHAESINSGLSQGDTAFAQGNLAAAETLYQDVIELDPQNVHAHHRLAIINDLRENYAASEKHYETALQHDRENLAILNDLGYSYYQQQRFEESKACFESILQIDESHQRAMQNLALVHAAEGDLQHAHALFQQGGLSHEQAQQRIQQVVSRRSESEGRATTHQSRMGLASTRKERPGEASTAASVATVNMSQERSLPGRTDLRSAGHDAFQPERDWESSYGMTPKHLDSTHSHSDHAVRQSPQSTRTTAHRTPRQQSVQDLHNQPVTPDIRQASYTPAENLSPSPTGRQATLIRTALNLGYGNLFPVIAPDEIDGVQRVNATADVTQRDARNAYYEEFGQSESKTPHVIHATKYQVSAEHSGGLPAKEGMSSHSAARIQTPNYESHPPETMTSPVPHHSFPVTREVQQTSSGHDYSHFPDSERPPFEESPDLSSQEMQRMMEQPVVFKSRTQTSSQQPSGIRIRPKSDMSYDRDREAGTGGVLTEEASSGESPSGSYDGGSHVAPMSDSARRAHEMALKRLQQQQ